MAASVCFPRRDDLVGLCRAQAGLEDRHAGAAELGSLHHAFRLEHSVDLARGLGAAEEEALCTVATELTQHRQLRVRLDTLATVVSLSALPIARMFHASPESPPSSRRERNVRST